MKSPNKKQPTEQYRSRTFLSAKRYDSKSDSLKVLLKIMVLLICLSANGKEITLPNGKSFTSETLEQMFFFNSIILIHRYAYIDCIDNYPKTKKEHSEAFKGSTFEALELSLSKFRGDPIETWNARKKVNLYGVGLYKQPSVEKCLSARRDARMFVELVELEVSKDTLLSISSLAKELIVLNEKELKEVIDAAIGIQK